MVNRQKGRIMKKDRYYLAYGSNLSVEQMAIRCPDAIPVGTAEIDGYQLLFKGSKTGSYLTIEKKAGSKVPVGVWKISADDEKSLDRYEGCPNFYYKKKMKVKVKSFLSGRAGKEVDALVYIMHEKRILGVPSGGYYRTCYEGYCRFGFNPDYLRDALAVTIGKKAATSQTQLWRRGIFGLRKAW